MKTLLIFVAMISCTVIANVLMKLGASGIEGEATSFVSRLFSWRILLGLSFFGIAALFYIVALGTLPLGIAQSFASAQFIAVVVASSVVLGETIAPAQWLGMVLIAAGITVVGLHRV